MLQRYSTLAVTALTTLALLALLSVPAGAKVFAGNTGWYWSNPAPQGQLLTRLSVAEGRVWAGGAAGALLRSDDGGRSWASVRTGLLDDIRNVEAVSRGSVVFAGSCALRRSDDGGSTVRRLPWSVSDDSCPAQIHAISFATAMVGHLLLSNGDIYQTVDGGESWRKQSVAPGSSAAGGSTGVGDVEFTTIQSGVLSVGGRIFRSDDGGSSWTPVAEVPDLGAVTRFSFVNDQIGFAVAAGGLLRTSDGGNSWGQLLSSTGTAQALAGVACGSAASCVASAAAGGSLLQSGDGGLNWRDAGLQQQISDVAATGAGSYLAVGPDGLIVVSADDAASFSRVDRRISGRYNGLHALSTRSALAFGASGAIARTTNAGSSWQQLSAPLAQTLLDADASGANVLALARDGSLWRSSNRGVSWKRTNFPRSRKARALIVWPGGRTAVVGRRGVRVSTSWGAGARAARGAVAGMTLTGADTAKGAAFVYGPRRIAVTRDRGRSWQRVAVPRGPATTVQLEMLDAKNGYLLDSRAELHVTKDGGRHWRRLETTGANSATSIAFGDRRHGYIADASGRILYTDDAGATWARQYPFYDGDDDSPMTLVGLTRLGALALVRGTQQIFATTRGGRIGRSTKLTIRASAKQVRRGTVVTVTGRLKPAAGLERVAVLARVASARSGTQWVTQNATVSATGNFSTRWTVTAETHFIARWSGDAAHDGDAAPLVRVKIRR